MEEEEMLGRGQRWYDYIRKRLMQPWQRKFWHQWTQTQEHDVDSDDDVLKQTMNSSFGLNVLGMM